MAATTASLAQVGAADRYFDKRYLVLATIGLTTFYVWVRWYEEVYGWSVGLDAFSPDFEKYWMNMLYIEEVLEVVVFSWLLGYLWKTRDRELDKLTPREEFKRYFYLLAWLVFYGQALFWGASYFTEQDGTWHQTIIRDTDFTPSHIVEFYLSYPVYSIIGMGSFMYARTRLPQFSKGISLPFLLAVVGPFMIFPNVALNEWGHTFWWMEELFVAPLHYGFVFFGWFALGATGVVGQIFNRMGELLKADLAKA